MIPSPVLQPEMKKAARAAHHLRATEILLPFLFTNNMMFCFSGFLPSPPNQNSFKVTSKVKSTGKDQEPNK
jgi:hypothetical protein